MKYSQLISFEPIESVLVLRDADKKERAQQHAKTFVMSAGLRKQLAGVVFHELQFQKPTGDNKGVFIVGNYGTGKTHLMSVVSAVCEHPDVRPDADGDAELEAAMAQCQGQFEVIRVTIGGTLKNLRDIVCSALTEGLERHGIKHDFPAQNKITNHDATFQEMMEKVVAKYPNKGLLFVVDELLDYLKGRNDQEIRGDLMFLREVGEFCKNSRFRFMAGIQERLFDNPTFAHQADAIRRVRDRFAQIQIQREEIKAVVSRRLLQKNEEQKKWIREYLSRFDSLYPNIAEKRSEFVDLFPVHPVYLEKFELIDIAEKREVLKTISASMKELLDRDVPENKPGLITYDSYWSVLSNDKTLRTNRDVAEVLRRVTTLEDKVKTSFPQAHYKDAAMRIVAGLGVVRLTSDIYAPVGLTQAEIRDGLFIHVENMPEKTADFLEGIIGTILAKILTTVNGQFISKNPENGQYYIDVKKDVDYDQNIRDRAQSLPEDEKDIAYFDALRKIILENSENPPYHRSARIWEEDVLWRERNAERPGYLFFGAPNERPTAQPPRDFYLYFLQVYNRPPFKDEKKADEVLFDLVNPSDEAFQGPLLRYAAAQKLAETQSHSKSIYQEKSAEALKELVTWLRKNLPTRCQVTWKGQRKLLQEWQAPGKTDEVRSMVMAVASACLNSHFEDTYPNYPHFEGIQLSRENREMVCKDALKQIGGGGKTKHGTALLEALRLFEGGELRPTNSPYAKPPLDALAAKKQAQVVTRESLMETVSEPHGIEVEKVNRIEPDLFGVVIAALCYHGDLVVAYGGGEKIEAATYSNLLRKNVTDLGRFKHVERPTGMPQSAVQAACRLLGVNPHLVKDPSQHDHMVREMQQRRGELVKRVVQRLDWVRTPSTVWGIRVISEEQSKAYEQSLNVLRSFLDSLQAFDTPAKLVKLKETEQEIDTFETTAKLLDRIDSREQNAKRLSEPAKYLESAALVLPESEPWHETPHNLKGEVAVCLAQDEPSHDAVRAIEQRLLDAKRVYQDRYMALHKGARLNSDGRDQRVRLLNSDKKKRLESLAKIRNLVDPRRLDEWTEKVTSIKACYSLVPNDLEVSPKCPHENCDYNPSKDTVRNAQKTLDGLSEELDDMETTWTTTLHSNLEDPIVRENIVHLDDDRRQAIEAFLKSAKLPTGTDLNPFVAGAMEVSDGLQAVRITMAEVRAALIASGSASKPDAVKDRFKELLDQRTRGTKADKVRIVFTDETGAAK